MTYINTKSCLLGSYFFLDDSLLLLLSSYNTYYSYFYSSLASYYLIGSDDSVISLCFSISAASSNYYSRFALALSIKLNNFFLGSLISSIFLRSIAITIGSNYSFYSILTFRESLFEYLFIF
jgi:hypothetical protein